MVSHLSGRLVRLFGKHGEEWPRAKDGQPGSWRHVGHGHLLPADRELVSNTSTKTQL